VAVQKQTWQRLAIWIIAITMTVGSLGAYFLIIMQNDSSQQAATNQTQQPAKKEVDPTAYKVEGKVNELQKTDLVEGTGDEVKLGDTIKVHYKGTLATSGVKFDSSYDVGEPVTFKLEEGKLIKGRLVIPSDLGYGKVGSPPTIPADADLVFEVELLAVNPK
jgi:FKBP-type peptidyl-prolyl cis-trans isomerase